MSSAARMVTQSVGPSPGTSGFPGLLRTGLSGIFSLDWVDPPAPAGRGQLRECAMSSMQRTVSVLLVIQAILIAMIVGMLAGILAAVVGALLAQAFISGAIAFGATVPLVLRIQNSIIG